MTHKAQRTPLGHGLLGPPGTTFHLNFSICNLLWTGSKKGKKDRKIRKSKLASEEEVSHPTDKEKEGKKEKAEKDVKLEGKKEKEPKGPIKVDKPKEKEKEAVIKAPKGL